MNRLRAYTGAAGALAILTLAGCGGSSDGGSTAPLAIVDTNPPSVISTTTRAALTTTTTPPTTTPTKTTTTTKTTTPKKTTSAPPTADVSGYEGGGGGGFYYFTSPTGKFECGIIITESSIAGCHGELPPTAPRVDDASAKNSKVAPNTIELIAGSPARFLSSGDPRFHRFEGTARALPYGENLSIPGSGSTNGLTCSVSKKAGVTCLDQVGHGFTVSDSAFELK